MKKPIRLPGKIKVKDEFGGRFEIKAPSLISLFFSKKLRKSYEKDPDKEYSIKDLCKMATHKCSESAIRGNLRLHIKFFETDEAIQVTKQGLMSVKVARLKPLCLEIFKAIDEDNNEK